jgi:hypothetical protein
MAARTPPPPTSAGGSDDGVLPGSERPTARLHWPHWISIAFWSGLISIVVAGTGLVWAVHPAWKPDPGEKQLAQASIVAIEKGVSSGDFAKRAGRTIKNPIEACLPGNVYYLQENLQGFKDRATSIVLLAYDKHGHQLQGAYPIVGGASRHPLRFVIKHSRTEDQSVVPVWWQWPYRTGKFFVRFELWRKQSLLALVDSPWVPVTQRGISKFVSGCNNSR